MNERIQQLYQQAHEPQPPTRGTGTLTKDILWEQPNKFNPEKFVELIIQECSVALNPMLRDMVSRGRAVELIKQHFGVDQ